MNETIASIMGRRSVRRYRDIPVDRDTIEVLLRAGMAAPSASNRQPWEIIVVTSKETLEELTRVKSGTWMLRQAPLCIAVCSNRERFYPEPEAQELWVQDCSAMTENILVAATSLGLGTCWCGVFPRQRNVEEVAKILGLPDGIIPLNLIALGYPNEDPPVKDKWRLERVHWEGW
ncbi:nitroreductase family protein [Chloroflexota bacterium]